jgi:hypothetical protein
MAASGRWYITHHAIERYMFARRMPDTDAAFERAERELIGLMRTATHRETRGDLQLWRSPQHTGRGLRWIVSFAKRPEGELPQVVWVGQGRPPKKWWSATSTTTAADGRALGKTRVTVTLPPRIHKFATRYADAADLSLAEYVAACVLAEVEEESARRGEPSPLGARGGDAHTATARVRT